MPNREYHWWEVHFSDKRDQPADLIKGVYTVGVEAIDPEDAEQDDGPRESTSFIESDAFFVVKTVQNDPFFAVARAVSMLYPDVMSMQEDVIWH